VRAVRRVTVDDAGLDAWTQPWEGLVKEAGDGSNGFEAAEGPFRTYRRTVDVTPSGDGRPLVTSTVDFQLALPYWNWLLCLPVRHALRNPGAPLPWWGPADRLDAHASAALGVLCMASAVAGYVGTSMSQTITYASADFHLHGDTPQTVALAATRVCVVLAVAIVALADRRGRRRLLLLSATGAIVLGATTSLAPNIVWYTAAQVLTRGCSTAMGVLITLLAAEEMPKRARAFGVSVLGMCAALGAGICVLALPLADTGEGGWRWLFVIPLVALPLLRHIAPRLKESRRFDRPHDIPSAIGHRERLIRLTASVFLLQLFTAPASQLQNDFLRDERNYSAFGISLFTVCTATPAGLGIVAGGRLADVYGRRIVGAIGLVVGIGGTVMQYLTRGASMWTWSLIGAVVGGMTLPALGVYGPELFPTGVRARANGVLVVAGVTGSAGGLLAAGWMSDHFGGLGHALAILAIGPAILAVLVLVRYPETAHLELEELNPEDARLTA
jgi:MFS family permease